VYVSDTDVREWHLEAGEASISTPDTRHKRAVAAGRDRLGADPAEHKPVRRIRAICVQVPAWCWQNE
jgi:hypothetical protein